MTLAEAQAEVRRIYRAGSVGQAYSGAIWVAAATAWTGLGETAGIVVLVVGGFLIYPVTTAVCRLLGSPGSIPATNPLRQAGVTIPIVGPLMIPLVGAAALYEIQWFFPAFMVAMGAHYLPFSFLYGMRPFLYLGGGMWAAGFSIGYAAPGSAVVGAWATGVALLVFAGWAGRLHRREEAALAG